MTGVMGKRRRERDKPKAAYDAPYNPNKRVLLSYDSDDEHEDVLEQPAGTGRPGAIEAVASNYEIPPYPEEGDNESVYAGKDGSGGPGSFTADPEEDGELEEIVDEKATGTSNNPVAYSRQTLKNEVTGQWPALGALSYQWDEEEEGEVGEYDSTEEEAMAYLRAVRSERQCLPTVLTAPQHDEDGHLYDSGIGDSRGYVSEGTYIGRPSIGPAMPESLKTTIEPQEAYTKALKQRFLVQREQMHVSAGPTALASLNDKHPISLPTSSNKAYAEWTRLLKSTAPLPAQIRAMDLVTVDNLLKLIQRMYLVRGQYVSGNVSTWIWSLVARLGDVGTMDNDQVYAVRELGKKAVLVQLSFHDPVAAQQLEAMEAQETTKVAESSVGNLQHADSEDAKSSGLPGPDVSIEPSEASPARENTLATLDMIITIVGEVFGQKDMLEFRQQWPAGEREPQPETS